MIRTSDIHIIRNITPLVLSLAVLLLGLAGLSSCSSDDGPAGVEIPTPSVTALSDSTMSPGDTLSVMGTNFASSASGNRVVFNNALASSAPFAAADTLLRVVVPDNANSGALYVTSLGAKSNTVGVTIERGVGDVWVMGGGTTYQFGVPASNGSEKYLIVAHSATADGVYYSFGINPGGSSVLAAETGLPTGESPRFSGTPYFAGQFETRAREEAMEYIRNYRGSRGPVTAQTVPQPESSPAETATFYVLTCTGCSTLNSANFVTISATLRYMGTHALIYSDDVQPAGSFTQGDYTELGQRFDSEIFPTNTTYFGSPTDIDGNGHIVILFTPRVNDLTPDGTADGGFISGFVLLNDLSSIFPAGTTNKMEIFYSMVPDPTGQYGNAFPAADVKGIVPGTLAHEFEHMISNGYRFVTLGGGRDGKYIQQTWLEEGMAHMAEDLNALDDQNIKRANRFLSGPYATSILGNAELRPDGKEDTLEQRGGVFLFLRYLGDQIDETIYKNIVRSTRVGISSVENVTGTNFYTSAGDFLATLYLSGRGITDDSKYNYTSIDLQNDFDVLAVSNRSVSSGVFNSSVRSVGGNFNLMTGGQPPTINFTVTSGQGSQIRVICVRTE